MPKEKDQGFYNAAKQIWSTVVHKESDDTNHLQLQLETHKRLLNLFQAGNYYYFIFNIFNVEIENMSSGITKVLGYTPEEVNVAFMMDKMHPDDKSYFLNFEYRIAEFFKQLPYEKIKNYKAQYDYRIKHKQGHYVRVLHQAVQIEYDEKNFYRCFDIHTDISHVKLTGAPVFSLIGLDDEPSYYNIQDTNTFKKSFDLFTKRERQILKCIVEGKKSKEIALELHISSHTINTHRKNILNKADCTSPVDLCMKAINEGWI